MLVSRDIHDGRRRPEEHPPSLSHPCNIVTCLAFHPLRWNLVIHVAVVRLISPPLYNGPCRHLFPVAVDVFAYLINERLPELVLDRELASHVNSKVDVGDHNTRRELLQRYFGSRMMGRCFCITSWGLMGLGSGFMSIDDVVVVPFGCSTPIILRPDGDEFHYVGDVYIRRYIRGRAVEEYEKGERELRQYVIH